MLIFNALHYNINTDCSIAPTRRLWVQTTEQHDVQTQCKRGGGKVFRFLTLPRINFSYFSNKFCSVKYFISKNYLLLVV